MNIEDLPDNSDTSDDDYVPDGEKIDPVSEEESDGDEEDPLEDIKTNKISQKRKKNNKKRAKKARVEEDIVSNIESKSNKKELSEKEQKEKVDALWADFKKDTGFKSKSEIEVSENSNKTSTNKTPENSITTKKGSETVKVTEIFEFAGETVKVEKEIKRNSSDFTNNPSGSSKGQQSNKARGGLGSVLSQIGKKTKINTLEKSKLDWETFKKEENISDELKAYSKSKDGYLERQDFLERADVRRFEIEKNIRSTLRNNRLP